MTSYRSDKRRRAFLFSGKQKRHQSRWRFLFSKAILFCLPQSQLWRQAQENKHEHSPQCNAGVADKWKQNNRPRGLHHELKNCQGRIKNERCQKHSPK